MYPYKVVFFNGEEGKAVYFETLKLAKLFTSYLFVKHGILAKVTMT